MAKSARVLDKKDQKLVHIIKLTRNWSM
jgi:hypothetical protein